MEASEPTIGKEKDKKMSWTKRVVNGDTTKSLEVKKVSNGYIVCISECGTDKDGKWYDKNREYISKENPLEDDEDDEKKSFSDQLDDLLDDMAEQDGMINIK